MKAIINYGKRCQVYNNELEVSQLKKFVTEEFPRFKEAKMMFKDVNGNNVNIENNNDLEMIKKMFNGQNFVEILLEGGQGKGHGRGHHHRMRSHSKGKGCRKNRTERRCLVLSKVYGGVP